MAGIQYSTSPAIESLSLWNTGSPEFTNEVQHLPRGGVAMGRRYKQLSLDDRMRDCPTSSRWVLGPANRGSSGSLAIDDLSGAETRNRGTQVGYKPSLRSGTDAEHGAGGLSPGTGALSCAARCWSAWRRLVARADCRPARPRDRPQGDLATRASTASSTPRSRAPRTIAGATICRAARASAASAAARAEAPQASLKAVFPWPNALRMPPIARPPATGKPTSCCSPNTARPC